MDFSEKAKLRMENWIHHNEHHQEDYEQFAGELDQNNQTESAKQIRMMIQFNQQSNDCLKNALGRLK